MDEMDMKRILQAISLQGSVKYGEQSGPFLDLLSELAKEQKFQAIAEAYRLFSSAYPANAKFVVSKIPAKIVNSYLLDGATTPIVHAYTAWSQSASNKDWGERLVDALHNPFLFDAFVRLTREKLIALSQHSCSAGRAAVSFRYQVQEMSAGGVISWQAVEALSGMIISIHNSNDAGEFPEIDRHLEEQYAIKVQLTFKAHLKDRYDQNSYTWTYVRGPIEVVVHDIPRTMMRVSRT
ncbi:MAG: hypothetical protein ACK4FK_14615 [Ferrovibrio sp.]|uniref:hypothetical protein n=1 Tax=Ferrovibrio sp. TaxID=1917215 RepID=UPI003918BEB6